MKLNQILKVAVIPFLAVLSCVVISTMALADYFNSEGYGGDYRYELWSTDDNSSYYLKIWRREASRDSESYITDGNFNSSSDALTHFDCTYARKKLPECR
ncbi:hypothetical protein NIES2100_22860 [Calothrix sp. NIES-2100]|uniref:hypothetical protein n=1 Tax=Calothrix sp. NIES-2100 TaxID=1954172 RepID=UPI000B60CBF9|nr:hypothetical protein NIES2100_22860 [Calothrix sp. NIES-2100]